MKTKIFLAFLIVILAALLSNFVFEWLMMRDFENYVSGVKEDQLYWVTASAESSYEGEGWNRDILSETIHWAMMMGLDAKILDPSGQEIISSHHMIESLPDVMKKRMEGLFHVDKTQGVFEEYPLYSKGKRIGTLYWRPFLKKEIAEKEAKFKKRTRDFLFMSFLIAGIGSLLIALLFSQYLSKPITDLKKATEKIAEGDFSVRTVSKTRDEVGKLAEVFNRMAESLQKEDQLRKQLMSNIAHELRTPLTIMRTHVEAIADGIVTDKEKGLKNINEEIVKLTKLIRGIEDITTAEASFFTRSEEKVNLKELLSGIIVDLRPLFDEKNLEIKILDDKDIVVVTDVEKLERVIRNILSNALKFTEKGSVSIHYGTDKKMFFIEIKDTGKGIPDKEITHIFDRFYKIEKTDPKGLGLGLAIVKELINVMNGAIKVRSTVHEGTSFTIFLPFSKRGT
jgi:two-component system sensor histidine kinase BaeS